MMALMAKWYKQNIVRTTVCIIGRTEVGGKENVGEEAKAKNMRLHILHMIYEYRNTENLPFIKTLNAYILNECQIFKNLKLSSYWEKLLEGIKASWRNSILLYTIWYSISYILPTDPNNLTE